MTRSCMTIDGMGGRYEHNLQVSTKLIGGNPQVIERQIARGHSPKPRKHKVRTVVVSQFWSSNYHVLFCALFPFSQQGK